ncbi:MAG: amidophosphoribosyltransferase [Bacteroidales bacterium]|nr:amidophosphoribosyltransferase [Bacteroidales bacterium]
MSDHLLHECGIAFIHLRKPLEYYLNKYGLSYYGIEKLCLLMEKQHNRGQDGAGFACLKLGLQPGEIYFHRERDNSALPIIHIFDRVFSTFKELEKTGSPRFYDVQYLKKHNPYVGEIYLGHVRYGTYGKNDIDYLHPQMRFNNWKTRSLFVAGNFNLTNTQQLLDKLISLGQHPIRKGDTFILMELIGYYLDEENDQIYRKYKNEGLSRVEISRRIADELDLTKVLKRASDGWDGGFVIAGLVGHGDGFVLRDPYGIRPCFYYADEEVIAVASERPVLQTTFDIKTEQVKELEPGFALVTKYNGDYRVERIFDSVPRYSCSFESIYFSRGTDAEIYEDRKRLGKFLVKDVLKAIDYDLENTVFSYIPNTALVAFLGLYEGLLEFCLQNSVEEILSLHEINRENIFKILEKRPRIAQIAVKDMKLRTFITNDKDRDGLVTHIYDVTYGVVREGIDNLVVVDDSIVRGTTLKNSIIKMLDRLQPKHIVFVSSAPQIRYPDCYGIDMAKLKDLVAFQAAIELLKETKQTHIIDEVYRLCVAQRNKEDKDIENFVKRIYAPFTEEEIARKVAELVTPPGTKAKVTIIYQSIDNLHKALTRNHGDWYFSGDYPTPGGNRVVNNAFLNYVKNIDERPY